MADENPNQGTQAEAARAEMAELMKSEEWRLGLPSATVKADTIYRKYYPETHGKQVTIDGDGPHLEAQGKAEARSQEDPWAAVRQDLAGEWGEGPIFEQNMELAQRTARELFPQGQEKLFEEIAQAFPDDATALRLLHKIGKRMGL